MTNIQLVRFAAVVVSLCLPIYGLSHIGPSGLSALADAPGAPGMPHQWGPALKEAFGTAWENGATQSPVWFTVAEGILTEAFYPRIDTPQIGDLQFLVTDGGSVFSEQKRDVVSTVRYSNRGATVLISGHQRQDLYRFEQEIVTDPELPVIRVRTTFQFSDAKLKPYLLFKPAIDNQVTDNVARATSRSLVATRTNGSTYAMVYPATPFTRSSAGYVGQSDGWQQLARHREIRDAYPHAGPGNVSLIGELPRSSASIHTYEYALAFGPTESQTTAIAEASLLRSFDEVRQQFDHGWQTYADHLHPSLTPFAKRSAQILKMHEDRFTPGAMIASPSKPGIPYQTHSGDNVGGYHLIWPRDLYHSAMGLLAAGDRHTPISTLYYLASIQKKDGSWSQNNWVDGTPYWTGIQLDEIAFPILLTAHLKARGLISFSWIENEMVTRAAAFIAKNGPTTEQDRWEEIGGYVPSTLATAISALRAASWLTGDPQWGRLAQAWNQQLENWTLVPQGPLGKNYYLRASPGGLPHLSEPIEIANGGGRATAAELMDGGFLELVRMGVRRANDPHILSTLNIYDSSTPGWIAHTSVAVPGALHYRRYNRDAYGPDQIGGYWPILAGERGHYAVAAGDFDRAAKQLDLLISSALPSAIIPEQIISADTGYAGLGGAAPLAWAHAEAILLTRSLAEGAVFDAAVAW